MRVKLTSEEEERLHAVKEKIDYHFKENFTNLHLSKLFHLSDHKLRHGFKQMFGVSVTTYHSNKKFNYALALIKGGTMSITEVAYHAGYNELSTFYRIFRKNHRETPLEWRENNLMIALLLAAGYSLYDCLSLLNEK